MGAGFWRGQMKIIFRTFGAEREIRGWRRGLPQCRGPREGVYEWGIPAAWGASDL